MATNEVYSPTTAPNPTSSWFAVPSKTLDTGRFVVKVCEVLLSFVAFILEETIKSCSSCNVLYFFEFVSCTAFLFTLLLLILLSTRLHTRVGVGCWSSLDFGYSAGVALLFLIASVVFASDNGNSSIEQSAAAFGFLATVIFLVDVGLFVKMKGFPWKKDGMLESSNGGPVEGGGPPEKEKLTTPPPRP
ncbi:CKLF-like MARVEL transmembrane domain-containing protein 6 [Brachionichthys hirsutus]|uniref:CKLF-like MARVEL transmembrane domain-containing protein 6 n=1 Tax=Brachionichthys hirsutus TaxID=412623 RepID=UPI0036052667